MDTMWIQCSDIIFGNYGLCLWIVMVQSENKTILYTQILMGKFSAL